MCSRFCQGNTMITSKLGKCQLSVRLATQIRTENDKMSAVAKQLGISPSYLSELLSCDKSFVTAKDNLLRTTAKYLNLPPVVCFLLAGKLRHQDFFEQPLDLNAQLSEAMRTIANSADGIECGVSTELLEPLPERIKLLLVFLYQSTTGAELIPAKKRWSWIEDSNRSDVASILKQLAR